tara:strand:- start:112 stop:771 length:660 start_codon:yes stop_codon:yes gene_type:complete
MVSRVVSLDSIESPGVPALPLAPVAYEQRYQDTTNNILRQYFTTLQNVFQSLLSEDGGRFIRFPYGAFSSDQDQTATANTATLMTLNTTDFSSGVSISSSKITVATGGIYNLQFSAQLENSNNAPQDVYIWLKQNGTDIVGSTGVIGMPARKNPGDPSHDIKGWNYFLSMTAGQYVEIYWSTTSVDVSIQFYAASGSPTKPATQSVVATMTFVSALPTI